MLCTGVALRSAVVRVPMNETPEPQKTERATDRQLALVAEESADGAYEIKVEPADGVRDDDGTVPGTDEPALARGRARWLAFAALAVAVAVVAAVWAAGPPSGSSPAPTAEPDEAPAFRAWIVPQEEDPGASTVRPGADDESETWSGQPRVAGVVYRGPDATMEAPQRAEEHAPETVDPGPPAAPRRPLAREAAPAPPRWHSPQTDMRVDPDLARRLRTVPVEASLELQLDALPDDEEGEWYEDDDEIEDDIEEEHWEEGNEDDADGWDDEDDLYDP